MFFRSLEITNFRAVKHLCLSDLTNMVVIAGPNGCGKSSIFDAIRLIKSAYGGYQPYEWNQWFGEFQINLDQHQPQLLSVFRDQTSPVRITAEVVLSEREKKVIKESGAELLQTILWRQASADRRAFRSLSLAEQLKQYGTVVEERTRKDYDAICNALSSKSFRAQLTITPKLSIEVSEMPVLQLVFSVFAPRDIGIVDYHGAQRAYQREQISGIDLGQERPDQKFSQHALYNYAQKYTNIKTEMAASYIRELIAKQAGQAIDDSDTLIQTLQELFETFFPDKKFLGPQPLPDGRLGFPVQTNDGAIHDVNDLSSGEKEVLYGYLRLRNISPVDSVLLLDEPELHLNPRLIRGLPQFYHKHLGKSRGNQIWLLTHSDTLLREALSTDEFSVFHMQHSTITGPDENQTQRIHASEELEYAIINLVGDLSTYKPGAKVVVFEGGGNSEFDLYMVNALFPEFPLSVNTISGGNKTGVHNLHGLLEKARMAGVLPVKFFSIVDRDTDDIPLSNATESLQWNVYHIENYLMEPRFILVTLQDSLGPMNKLQTEQAVLEALRECAKETMPGLVRHRLEHESYKRLKNCISTHIDRKQNDIAISLRAAIEASLHKITTEVDQSLQLDELQRQEREIRAVYENDLSSGNWMLNFRGREILNRFTSKFVTGMKYENFRNLIIARMKDEEYKPAGMASVLEHILRS